MVLPIQSHRPVDDIYQKVGKGRAAYEATFEDLRERKAATLHELTRGILFYVIDPSQGRGRLVRSGCTPSTSALSLLGAAAGVRSDTLGSSPGESPFQSHSARLTKQSLLEGGGLGQSIPFSSSMRAPLSFVMPGLHARCT